MAIDLTLNIQNGQSGGSTDTVVNKPTGTVDGDFLLMAIMSGSGTPVAAPGATVWKKVT